MRHYRGFSLLELVFALLMVVIVLIPMTGLFPMGHAAVQKARYVSTASALAQQRLNEVDAASFPAMPPGGVPLVTSSQAVVGPATYTITTQITPAGYRTDLTPGGLSTRVCILVDVVVQVSTQGNLPVQFSTRLAKDAKGMHTQ